MLSKITSKNQITLPKAILAMVPTAEYFEVEAVNDCIVLRPVRIQKADAVREKMALLKISEADIDDAMAWARQG